jgi:hypothetical protein
MNIDWLSLIHEARVEAWKNVGTIMHSFWDALLKMLTSGEPLQFILGIIIVVGIVISIVTGIKRIIFRLIRNAALDF